MRGAENIIGIPKKLAVLLGVELSEPDERDEAGPQEHEPTLALVEQLAEQEGVSRA